MGKFKDEISELMLEKYSLGELPLHEQTKMEQRLAENTELKARLHEIQQSNSEILERYPAKQMAASIRKRLGNESVDAKQRMSWAKMSMLAAPAFLLIAVLAAYPVFERLAEQPLGSRITGVEHTRLKGSKPHLILHRKQGDLIERLQDNDMVYEHDVIQISYVPVGKAYGVIFSIDGRGTVTMHFPESGNQAGKLEAGGEIPLSHAYELDDAPQFERFLFVQADSAFSLNVPFQAVRELRRSKKNVREAPLELPQEFSQYSFLLNKGVKR